MVAGGEVGSSCIEPGQWREDFGVGGKVLFVSELEQEKAFRCNAGKVKAVDDAGRSRAWHYACDTVKGFSEQPGLSENHKRERYAGNYQETKINNAGHLL